MAISKKSVIVIVLILIALAVGLFAAANFLKSKPPPAPIPSGPIALLPVHKVIGTSVEGRDIEAYTYGIGDKHIVFVGGIHGGYEWNSVLLVYQFMDYLARPENAAVIPSNLIVSVIPSANPDGVYKVIGKNGRFALADVPKISREATAPGRFNAHGVDLNRNFDCKWKPESTWQSKIVRAATAPFSAPEAAAIRNFVLGNKSAASSASGVSPVSAVIFWHSQANAVYASECEAGILPATLDIMNVYSKASGYTPVKTFDSYAITGDAEGWLASIGIPAITVELQSHETTEWDRNLAGIKAILDYYKK